MIKKILRVVPVVALIIGALSLYKTCKNESQIDQLETKYLQRSTQSFANELDFIRPNNGDTLNPYSEYIIDVSFKSSVPENYKVWIVGRNGGSYYLLGNKKSMHIDLPNRILSKSGVRLSDEGEWEIILYLTTLKANKELDEGYHYFGFEELPKGMSILKSIRVFSKYP